MATCVALLLAVLSGSLAHAADDYLLGTMDKLRIRVAEWRTAEGAVRDWATINGDYAVGPAGNISVPFVGEMAVTGKTTAEVADMLGDQLQQKFGLIDRPYASVELAEFRPFFVSGDVQTPGLYPFAPGLTVLKAVSIAGGMRRAADGGQRFERDFISARGNFDVFASQRIGIVARRARLIAEAEGKDKIDFPKELGESALGKKLIADETAFKAARENQLRLRLGAIEDLKGLLQSEIDSLEKKIATQNRQIDLSRKELDSIGNLAQKGLVVNERILTRERQTAELEGKVLDMETAMLRARQDISKAAQDATDLQNERATDIAQQRQQAEADIQTLDMRIAMYRDLMGEAMANDATVALAARSGAAAPVIGYSIVRDTDGKPTETPAEESTPVLPGDVVKASIDLGPAD